MQSAIRQRPQSGAVHLGVGLAFNELIKGEGPATRQRGAYERVQEAKVVRHPLGPKIKPDQGRN